MSDIRPLPIYSPVPLKDEEYQLIREAKQSLGLPFLVQFAKAVPGTVERVLAIGGKPPFLCEYAQIPNTMSVGLKSALEWVLTDKQDSRAMLLSDVLSEWMGAEVKEVTDATESELSIQPHEPESVGTEFGLRGPVDPGSSREDSYRAAIQGALPETETLGE